MQLNQSSFDLLRGSLVAYWYPMRALLTPRNLKESTAQGLPSQPHESGSGKEKGLPKEAWYR
jgi:hypothetical protein